MSGEHRESSKTELALALAQGISCAEWARANNVPKMTAYRWASQPKVLLQVEACRRRAIDRAVGQMTKRVTWVVGRMHTLAKAAESESVQLSALKALLANMMSVSKYSGLEGRMARIEENRRKRTKRRGRARGEKAP